MTLKVNPVTPLASPLGEEGHEVAKGVQANWIHRGAPRPANPVRRHPAKSVWTRVRMIMIFLFYVLSLFDWGPPIGGQDRDGASYRCSAPYTLCLFEAFPSRGNEKIGGTGYCVTYDTESQSRNADFICIARRAVKLTNLKNPRAKGPSTLTPAGRVQSPKNMLDIMCPAHYNSHNLRKQTVEAEIKIIRALTGSRGIEKPAGRRLLNGPLRAR